MIRLKAQRAFALAELVTALLVFGLLASFAVVQLRTTAGASAQALALYNTTQKMAAGWRRLASNCGVASIVSHSPLLASSNVSAIDVLVTGAAAVNSKFQACYQDSRLRPMIDSIRSSANGWIIQNFTFSLDGGGSQPFIAQFNAVPHDVTLNLSVKYGQLQDTDLANQDLTNPVIRYQPDNTGAYTVWILVGSPDQLVLASPPTLSGTSTSPRNPLPPSPLGAISAPPVNGPPAGLPSPPAITASQLQPSLSLATGGGIVLSGGGSCSAGASSPACSSSTGGSAVAGGGAATSPGSGSGTVLGTPAPASCLVIIGGTANDVWNIPPTCDVIVKGLTNDAHGGNKIQTADPTQYDCVINVTGTANEVYMKPNTCASSNVGGIANGATATGNNVTGIANDVGGSGNSVSGTANNVGGGGNSVSGTANNVGGGGNSVSGTANDVSGSSNNVTNTANDVSGTGNSVSGLATDVSGSNNTISGTAIDVNGNGIAQ